MDNSDSPQNHSTIREATQGSTYEPIHPERHHIHQDSASARTASVDNTAAPNSEKYDQRGGVNVQRAEADFAQLSKELSRTSNISRRLSRAQSRQSHKNRAASDVEKAVDVSDASSDEPFDLEATLRGNRDEEEAAGIKSKRIGVVWDGLTVSGVGGVKNYVKASVLPNPSKTSTLTVM